MRIAIAGGTGTLGRRVANELHKRGHEVRVLSRGSGDHRVDLRTGVGLDRALAGCHVLVDASNGSTAQQARRVFVDGSRRMLAAGQAAGVEHHVCVSIVGCDRVPMGYFQTKTAQERIVEHGPVPWTIVRATQFHEFAASVLDAARRWHVVPLPRARVQTVACSDAAQAVADIAEGAPLGKRVNVAGPEIVDARDLVATWRSVTHPRVLPLPIYVPGPLGRALRGGALTAPAPDVRGTTTFAAWLADQQW